MSAQIIEEQGIVKSFAKGVARVEISRPSCGTEATCAKCICAEGGRMVIDVETDLDLKEGQEVTLQIVQPPMLSAVFIVFVLPLVCLVVGIAIGNAVFGPWGALLGVGMCALSFVLVSLYDRHLRVAKRAFVRILLSDEQR